MDSKRKGGNPLFFVFFLAALSCQSVSSNSFSPVKFGSEVAWQSRMFSGNTYAILTNSASQAHFNLVDSLIDNQKISLIFSPEHSFHTNRPDGDLISDTTHLGIPVYSAYLTDKTQLKTLAGQFDTLLIDIQDVGLRYYTYVATAAKLISLFSDYQKPIVILDRPNPFGGQIIQGPIRLDSLKSIVSHFPIPIQHGLTIAEIFNMAIGEGWIPETDLKIIPMSGWKRNMMWDDTGFEWVPTSPNLPTFHSLVAYSGTCLFEGTTLSEGRGTETPFQWIGMPQLDTTLLPASGLFGVQWISEAQTPVSIPGKTRHPKFENLSIQGIRFIDLSPDSSLIMNWTVSAIQSMEFNQVGFKINSYFFKLWGIPRFTLSESDSVKLRNYSQVRSLYLLYQ